MKLSHLPMRFRVMQRYRDIFGVLLKYGFDEILERMPVAGAPGLVKKIFIRRKARPLVKMTTEKRVRLVIEELGPTFIKLGQMLSTRPDLIPVSYVDELSNLQHSVAPFSSQEARGIIRDELGKPVTKLFSSFEDRPIAAASIAQVHRAVALSGRDVVVKVQRPGIKDIISRDMEILTDLASLLERRLPEKESWDPLAIVEEFKSWIMKELDFMQEGRNIDRFSRNFAEITTLEVPDVIWECSTARVLTMEYVGGVPILDLEELDRRGLDRAVIAHNGAEAMLTQVFKHGFFHGDPHPGNLRVQEGNIIVPLDFGLMGRLNDELLQQLGSLLVGVLDKDIESVERALLGMQVSGTQAGSHELRRDLDEFIDRYYRVPLAQLSMEQVLHEMIDVCKRHELRLPRDLYLMVKALVLMEGIGRTLDPEFDIVSMAKPYARDIMIRRMNLSATVRRASFLLDDVTALLKILPENIKQIVLKMRRGEFGINLYHRRLDSLIREIDQSSNRISFSLIIAALIIGSSFVMQIDKGPKFYGLPVFGFIGYSLAAVLGIWLVIGIIRSGRL